MAGFTNSEVIMPLKPSLKYSTELPSVQVVADGSHPSANSTVVAFEPNTTGEGPAPYCCQRRLKIAAC